MLSILDPIPNQTTTTTILAHGCYAFEKRVKADDDDEPAEARRNRPAPRIDVTLLKWTSAGSVQLYQHANVPRTDCSNSRWITTFGAAGSGENIPVTGAGEWLQVVVEAYSSGGGNPETRETSPFYTSSEPGNVQEPVTRCRCRPVSTGEEELAGERGDGGCCCEPVAEPPHPVRADVFSVYTTQMRSAVCAVFDARTGMPNKGIVSLTPAEFVAGRCAAFVPVPDDLGAVPYGYKFLILDATGTVVLHNTQPKPIT